MAYIRKRGKTWYYTIDTGPDPATGKRSQKTKGGFRTQKEAQTAAAKAEIEVSQGTYIEESDITFGQFAQDWLRDYEKTAGVKISTVQQRGTMLRLLLPFFEHARIKDVTKKQYQDTLNTLQDRGYADSTIRSAHATGRMIFKKAIEFEIIRTDPTSTARVPRTIKTVEELEREEAVPEYLEKEELVIFLDAAKEYGLDMDYEMFLTLAYTGMRSGEECALTAPDVLDHEISITKTLYAPKKGGIQQYEFLTPKTKTSRRVIDVDEVVTAALRKRIAIEREKKMRYRGTYHDAGFVFTSPKLPGYPAGSQLVYYRMKRLLKIAGLNENLSPHSLRHTHTSLLAEAGADLQEIMDRLGHEDDITTTRVYLHVTQARKKETAQKFSQLMRRARGGS